MPCQECGAPVVTYDDNGEHGCSEDPSHDIDGSEANDDELNEPNRDEQDYDPENPASWDPASQPWSIGSDGEAEWALAKVQRARFEIEQISLRVRDEMIRLTDWQERVSRGPLRDAEFFEGHLARYYDRVRAEGRLYGKSKTYPLVNGTISARDGSESVNVSDIDALRDYAEGSDRLDLVNIKVTPKKTEIRKALKAGEQIPGVELVRGDESVTVTPNGGEPPAWLPMPKAGAA